MINLLPPDTKQSLLYARRNTILLRWMSALAASIAVLAVVVLGGHLYINHSIANTNKQIADTQEQLKLQKLETTQKRVQDISTSLKLVVQVLSKEVLFSKLLRQIGSAMPDQTILTGLSINKLQGGIDLQARATDYKTATQVQLNLADPNNKIFDKADIVNVKCDDQSQASSTTTSIDSPFADYPCFITLRAKFATNNPFLFINDKPTTGAKP